MGEGERRRPCRGGEGAGLGVERVEGSEEMLHPRRIDEGLTVGGESAAAATMERKARVWGGKEGRSGVDKGRASEGAKGGTARDDERHVARKPRMDAGDDACGAGE